MKLNTFLAMAALLLSAGLVRPAFAGDLEDLASGNGVRFDANATCGSCQRSSVSAGTPSQEPRLGGGRQERYHQRPDIAPPAPQEKESGGSNWGTIAGLAGGAAGLLLAPWLGIPALAAGLIGSGAGAYLGGSKKTGLALAAGGIGAWAAVGLFSAGPVGMVAGGLIGAAVGLFASKFFSKSKADA